MDAVERVETSVRAEIALCLGQHDVFAHTKPCFFRHSYCIPDQRDKKKRTKHQQWIDRFEDAVQNSRDEFILYHEQKYGSRSPLPLWVAIELWDFGRLSHFYSGMETQYRVSVANRFRISHRDILESWLINLNYVRNVIAHHGCLWNRNLVDNPQMPKRGTMPDFDVLRGLPSITTQMYSVCCVLSHFTKTIDPKSDWSQKLAELVKEFPQMPHASIKDMGFPADWQSHNFWS